MNQTLFNLILSILDSNQAVEDCQCKLLSAQEISRLVTLLANVLSCQIQDLTGVQFKNHDAEQADQRNGVDAGRDWQGRTAST